MLGVGDSVISMTNIVHVLKEPRFWTSTIGLTGQSAVEAQRSPNWDLGGCRRVFKVVMSKLQLAEWVGMNQGQSRRHGVRWEGCWRIFKGMSYGNGENRRSERHLRKETWEFSMVKHLEQCGECRELKLERKTSHITWVSHLHCWWETRRVVPWFNSKYQCVSQIMS